MFRKLVSNISFSPALVGQLGFYAKRLRKEEATRRVGLIFTVLALIVQSFVIFSPPAPANAASSNDMVVGGVTSKAQYMSNYDNNTHNLKDIYNALGVTRAELASMTEGKYINTASNHSLLSWGHDPKFSYAQGERAYTLPTANGSSMAVYARPNYLWGNSTIKVMIGHSAKLGTFYVMYACGNLITTTYPPVQKCPANYTGVYPSCKPPVCQYDHSIPATSPSCKAPICPANTTGTPPHCAPIPCPSGTTGTYPKCSVPPCQLNSSISSKDNECQPCPGDISLWIKDSTCSPNLIPSKTAVNVTQDNKDATTVVANGGDKIEYHLSMKNTGKAAATATFTENLSNLTDYATVLDTGGGSYDKAKQTLTWPNANVNPGQTVARIFSVQVDNPVPSVAQGVSDPTSFDCKMLNTFGNSITIAVNCPAVKEVEAVTTSLPHTGASENLLFAGGLLAVVSFFYVRSRQLKKEVRLIRRDINTGTI